jgi:hypothetical protein
MEKQNTSENGCRQPETASPLQGQMTETGKEIHNPVSDGSVADEIIEPGEDNYEYLAGFKLVLVMSTVTGNSTSESRH